MNGSESSRIAEIERRLGRPDAVAPPPELRRRILAAVDDVLAERPSVAVAGWSVARGGVWPRVGAVAAAVVCAIALPLLAGATTGRRVEPLSLAHRLRAAGVADDVLLAVLVMPPQEADVTTSVPAGAPSALPPVFRAIDARRIFAENL